MKHEVNLYVVVERSVLASDGDWLTALASLAGLDTPGLALQVRMKDEPPQRAGHLAAEARQATGGSVAPVLLNGDSQTAQELGYDGVHWPEELIPESPHASALLRSASVHSATACTRAEAAGADFLVAGTVFDAGSKPVAGAGLDALRQMTSATSLPVLAIGGVTPQRVASCLQAGASGVAVVTSVLLSADMAAAVAALREALDEARVIGRPRR